MRYGNIFKIKKYALHDGPGIRTTVFLKGCPLACRWCHNPEGISFQAGDRQGDTLAGWSASVAQVVAEIEKDRIFYDQSGGGVTFSGGEPTAQPEFLEALLVACRERAIHTALDTSGWASADIFARLADLADLILFDLKIVDSEAHRIHTGQDNGPILANFAALLAGDKPLSVRLPLIADVTDSPSNIDALVALLLSGSRRPPIDLLPYHAIAGGKYERLGLSNPMADTAPPAPEAVAAVRQRLIQSGFIVTIGG
jgi:pyruvate formate lyase activating enzyme